MKKYQIRSQCHKRNNDSPIIYEGTKERALIIWEKDGYEKMVADYKRIGLPCPFGLYEVVYSLLDGGEVMK